MTPWRAATVSLAVLLVAALAMLFWQSRELGSARPPSVAASEPSAVAESPRIFVTAFQSHTPDHRELDPLAASLREEFMLQLGRHDVRVVAAESRCAPSAIAGTASND